MGSRKNIDVSLSIFYKRLKIHSFLIKAVSVFVAAAAIITAMIIGHSNAVDNAYFLDMDGNKRVDNPRNYAIYMFHNRIENEYFLRDFIPDNFLNED